MTSMSRNSKSSASMPELGFVNLDWRKGTDFHQAPLTGGTDGSKHFEKWFVDCKHCKKGVPPERLQGLWGSPHFVSRSVAGGVAMAITNPS
jgi:hypothetical protein